MREAGGESPPLIALIGPLFLRFQLRVHSNPDFKFEISNAQFRRLPRPNFAWVFFKFPAPPWWLCASTASHQLRLV